jgi:hypothetical protein
MNQISIEGLDRIVADLNYLAPTAEPLVSYAFDPPEGVSWSNVQHETHRVSIRNLRRVAADLTLDRAGFELLPQKTAVKDFYDEDEVKNVYYPEAEAFLKDTTGATRVLIFDHTRRRRVPGADDRGRGFPRQPATRVHVDQSANAGPSRLRYLLPDEAEELLQHRYAIVNLWRPVRGPLVDAPLAVADARSVAPQDLVPNRLLYPSYAGETYAVAYNPDHRWYYAPAMEVNEVLLLKCFDSVEDGQVARFAPHGSFTDPTTPPDAAPRESIELRTYLFFGPDAADRS